MKKIDLSLRKYKYLVAAVIQAAMLYLWHKPFIKTKQPLQGVANAESVTEYLEAEGLAALNIAYIAISVLGILLFFVPLVVKDRYIPRIIDLPIVVLVFPALWAVFSLFNERQKDAMAITEFGVITECAFTLEGMAFFALSLAQVIICIVCRIQARREKLLL